jgi:hypothetical protein
MKVDGEKGAFGDVLIIHGRNTLQGIRNRQPNFFSFEAQP